MLTKRAQILFDQEVWNSLEKLAREKNTSVGELVRTAVKKQYYEEEKQQRIEKAVKDILEFRRRYGRRLARGEDSTNILRRMRDSRYGESI